LATQETEQVMKEVFIVDGNLGINPVQVPLTEWEHPSAYFSVMIGDKPIIALRGGRNKITTYAGFETSQEAEEFRDVLKGYETHEENAPRM